MMNADPDNDNLSIEVLERLLDDKLTRQDLASMTAEQIAVRTASRMPLYHALARKRLEVLACVKVDELSESDAEAHRSMLRSYEDMRRYTDPKALEMMVQFFAQYPEATSEDARHVLRAEA